MFVFIFYFYCILLPTSHFIALFTSEYDSCAYTSDICRLRIRSCSYVHIFKFWAHRNLPALVKPTLSQSPKSQNPHRVFQRKTTYFLKLLQRCSGAYVGPYCFYIYFLFMNCCFYSYHFTACFMSFLLCSTLFALFWKVLYKLSVLLLLLPPLAWGLVTCYSVLCTVICAVYYDQVTWGPFRAVPCQIPRRSTALRTNSENKYLSCWPVNSRAHASTNSEASDIDYTNDISEPDGEASSEVNNETNMT